MYLSSAGPLSLHINMTYKPYHNLLISHNTLCICNQGVTGSIPVGGTKFPNDDNGLACCRRFHFVSRKVINSYKQIFGVRVWGEPFGRSTVTMRDFS